MSRAKDPEQLQAQAAATQPSRTLKILAQLRGESASDLLGGYDDESDPALAPLGPADLGVDPTDATPPLTPSEQGRVARFRLRAGAYRGTSPTTRR